MMISEKQASRSVNVLRGLERVLLYGIADIAIARPCRRQVWCAPIVLGTALLKKGVNDLDKPARTLSRAVPAGAYGSVGEAAAGFDRLSQCPR
jgi:hypothetical protein